MGHERIGFLPQTQRWREVVLGLQAFSKNETDIATIGDRILRNVRSRFENLPSDRGINAAFTFLIALGAIARHDDLPDSLKSIHIDINDSPLAIAKAAHSWIDQHAQSREYAEISKRALADAVTEWFRLHDAGQANLFSPSPANADVWRPLGDGGAFSDLSRRFVAKITERYINYFLEREASSALPALQERVRMQNELSDLVGLVSRHAFASAKITQTFSAGWFNKHVRADFPTQRRIRGFLSFALHKMQEELRRQAEAA